MIVRENKITVSFECDWDGFDKMQKIANSNKPYKIKGFDGKWRVISIQYKEVLFDTKYSGEITYIRVEQ